MQSDTLEPLLNRAKELEKRYEWLQATGVYEKATNLALKDNDLTTAAEIQERIGYGFFRAALQAETRKQFGTRMRLASKTYEKASEILHKCKNEKAMENHVRAMVAYTSSWFEPNLSKMETLLGEWWTLENRALLCYEKMQNPLAIGKTCNNLMEYSVDRRIFFDFREYPKRIKELIDIANKAITILTKTDDKYELARAYCWASWYYGKSRAKTGIKNENLEKSRSYANKALSLSKEVGDGWLIGWSYNSISSETMVHGKNFTNWLNYSINLLEQGRLIKDNYMSLTGKWKAGMVIRLSMVYEENPEKKRDNLRKSVEWAKEAIAQAKLINSPICILLSQLVYVISLIDLSSLETSLSKKRNFMKKAIGVAKEGIEYSKSRAWAHSSFPIKALTTALLWLSKTETNNQEKRRYLEESLKIRKEFLTSRSIYGSRDQQVMPTFNSPESAYLIALTKSEIAKLEIKKDQKIALFKETIFFWEKCVTIADKLAEDFPEVITGRRREGFYYNDFGDVLHQIYILNEDKTIIFRTIEIYNKAIKFFDTFNLTIHAAKTYWKLALIYNKLGDYLKSSQNYRQAIKAYRETTKKIPQLKNFCENHSIYMQAWSEIEQAKHKHSREEYSQAKIHYETAGRLHEQTDDWSYLSSNYFAWSKLEQAEELSRTEKPQEAINEFQIAIELFKKTETNIKTKINTNPATEEKDSITKILKASDFRCQYCQARILMEEAKLLDREGRFLDSSAKYGDASKKISTIVDKVDNDVKGKELEYVAILCQAWEKMANAEEVTSAESYLEAAELFEQSKDYCFTRKASLWALGNSNFCRGLAAGLQYKTSLDLADHAKAKGYIKTASTDYLQAGFKNASEYAKATQRLFDAYVIMNQAEGEINQEKRAKQYQMAENLLQLSADSFMKAKQPEKTNQVQEILASVREEKALAVSLSQVMQAPKVVSTTTAFSAPTPTSESSVGLDNFEHANVQANLVTTIKQVKIGESFCLSIEFVNAGREPALLMRVEDFVPQDFVVVKKPEIYRIEETSLNMKGKQIAPLKLVEVKLTLQASKKGDYRLNPKVHYLDEVGKTKFLQLKTLDIIVNEVLLKDRVSTGTHELDSLLLGGIPEEYAVALTGSPSDEREMIITNFLEDGVKDGISFYVTTEATDLDDLLKNQNFFLFLCNPKPKGEVPDLSNVFKLQGKTDLTNLGIALVKAQRSINQSVTKKRICVEILSDVLVKHRENTTREWISGLITNLGAKGFTMLAVINPTMHPSDQVNAVLDLFDGEVSITQSDDPLDCKKSIHVKKLRNQDYIKNPICLR